MATVKREQPTTDGGDEEPSRESPTDNKEIVLHPEGDVILIVGPQETRLLVSAHCLRFASIVLFRMVMDIAVDPPTFLVPIELRLADDDARLMHVLCCILHHRSDQVDIEMKPKETYGLALLCRKYKCITALWPMLSCCLSVDDKSKHSAEDYAYLVTAAYIAKADNAFSQHSAELMTRFKGPNFSLLEAREIFQHLPGTFFYLMAERATRARLEIDTWINTERSRCCDQCADGTRRSEGLRRLKMKYIAADLMTAPILDVIEDLRKVVFAFPLKTCHNINRHSVVECERKLDNILKRASISILDIDEWIAVIRHTGQGSGTEFCT